MNSYVNQLQENKNQKTVAVTQKRSNNTVSNYPSNVAQMQLQEIANNSTQVKQALQLRAIANSNSALPIQKKGVEEEELQMKTDALQRKGVEEEELQMKAAPIQRKGIEEEEAIQGKFALPIQKKANNTGLPDNLKSGIENLSGFAMDDVKVHYNSAKPAQLQAHAYAQGSDIHIASGQEKHLPHEAWHVVQQKQGRVQPTMQMKGNVNINDDAGLENEADVMGEKAISVIQGKLMKSSVDDDSQAKYPEQIQAKFSFAKQNSEIVQRLIIGYKAGTTLAKTTKVMKNLTKDQRAVVQSLHNDNEGNEYSPEDARAQAIEEKPEIKDDDDDENEMTDEEEASNPYSWEVIQNAAFTSADESIQSIVNNFGHPTQPVVAIYQDLGARIAYEIKGKPKASLDKTLVDEIYQLLDAQVPLHFGDNPFLSKAWEKNLKGYKGGKSGKSLYALLRSKLTGDLRGISDSVADFDEILKAVSGRPPEVHHFLFKAIYGDEATMNMNLGLVERSEREKEFGPGQHELMHYVASGANHDKFKVLTQQFVDIYNQWVKDRFGVWLLKPIK